MRSAVTNRDLQDDLVVTAYRGDGTAMLAFDLKESICKKNLAGFTIKRIDPSGKAQLLFNRLSFENPVTNETTAETRKWTSSDKAPFQKFRWVDFPPDIMKGAYTYQVTARYFRKSGDPESLEDGPSSEVSLDIANDSFDNFQIGFTRGYMSSQAYAEKFRNAAYRPRAKSLTYDKTNYTDYERQYEWLGYNARQMVFDFLDECIQNGLKLDVFAYDLDEPLFVYKLTQMGNRLRAFLDDSSRHKEPDAMEVVAKEMLMQSAGKDNIRLGHFGRYAHNKVLIQRKADGTPIKVLTGSLNFTIRGLYVQANNVLVFEDADTAKCYAQVFDKIFEDPSSFSKCNLADRWFDINCREVPVCSLCFSPHKNADISLSKVEEAIRNANSSVIYAVMDMSGTGDVIKSLRELPERDKFSYGVVDQEKDMTFYKPGRARGIRVPAAFLERQVPPPFRQEILGGTGRIIHHKFVVVDFNDENPVVFTGSSNLAEGGEKQNGDNLIMICDPGVAMAYAVEAVRLIDHFHFRAVMKKATDVKPLMLKTDDSWWKPYYDPDDIKQQDRMLFADTLQL